MPDENDNDQPQTPGPDAGDYNKPDDLGLDKVGDDKREEEKTL